MGGGIKSSGATSPLLILAPLQIPIGIFSSQTAD